jgi:hypothetical protein
MRSCAGTDHDPKCRYSHAGTFNAPYFDYYQLHDELQFPGGELSNQVLHSECAWATPEPEPRESTGDR